MSRHAEPRVRPGTGPSGFTLVELIVTVATLGILASLAMPSYLAFTMQVRRGDGRALLEVNAQRLQRCFTLEGVYDAGCVLRENSAQGHYSLTEIRTATTFALTATPVADGPQALDTACASLTYSHTGLTGASGVNPDICW